MGFFRKRPVVVEARFFDPHKQGRTSMGDLAAWCGGTALVNSAHIVIKTLEGEMQARPGDWIIKGVNGEFYPCKPDVFAKTYEPEDEAQANASPLTARDSAGIARQAVADGLIALAETHEDGPCTDDNGHARRVLLEASAAVHDGTLPALIARREKAGRWPVNILDAAEPCDRVDEVTP